MMKKVFALLVALMMVLGMGMAVAEESETLPLTTNGQYTNGEWAAANNSGVLTYDVSGTQVKLYKTAKSLGNDEFEITLKVETSTSTSTVPGDGAVVLVIDVSGSMDFCAECGGEVEEFFGNTYTNHADGCKNEDKSSYEASRIKAAKDAAKTFLASYAGTNSSVKRMLSIVTFAKGYTTKLAWVNVAGGASGSNSTSYNNAVNAIDGLSANGGTNLSGGLYTADLRLQDDAIKNIKSQNVVMLTDGVPTYRVVEGTDRFGNKTMVTDGNGSDGSSDNNAAAKTQADSIKKRNATLYTVCFGVADEETYDGGPTVGNFLKDSVASSGCAYNADNTTELNNAFKSITESITSGLVGDGWTATDPMASGITVTSGASDSFVKGNNDTYTWTLGSVEPIEDENGVKTYIYTYTYKVKLDVQDPNFTEGEYTPTNERTYLNFNDENNTKLEFPVPGVTGYWPRTSVTASKVWSDANDQDGLRPESVTFQLKKDGVAYGDPVTVTESYTWNNLIEKSKGVTHVYTVEEVNVPDGYKASYDDTGLVVTNTHAPEETSVTVNKVWADNGNQDGIRPASVKVQLYANGTAHGEAVELNADGKWTYTWTKLAKKAAGQDIVYTVDEVEVPTGYTKSVEGTTITNTHAPEETSVTVNKVWADNDNQDGIRPASVKVQLYANGTAHGEAVELNADGKWTYTWTKLAKKAAGQDIVYTVDEVEVPTGYTKSVEGTTITNTHAPEKTSVSGQKVWDDKNNQDGIRPESITVNLLANGTKVASQTVTAATDWKFTFENLDKYADGVVIVYSVTEEPVDNYTPSIEGTTITNSYTPGVTSVTAIKSWEDNNDQDGIRPESIQVQLYADAAPKGDAVTLSEENDWTYTWTGLDLKSAGKEIKYTIDEVTVPDGYKKTVVDGTITNTHTPATITVSGTKTWNDANNQDGKRPESITINLLADGEQVKSATVSAEDEWKYEFTDLPKFKNKGTEIVYTITEDTVTDYTTKVEGFDVTNSYTPGKTSVTGAKTWVDNDNQDGKRPESITINLLADGVKVDSKAVTADDKWTWEFADLDEYKAGKKITYTITEDTVEGYTTKVDGYNVTNTHEIEKVKVEGSKTWVGDDENMRPDSITINLLADGVEVAEKVVSADEDGNWTWSFTDLDKYKAGKEIVYTITEDAVKYYKAEVKGYNVTNTRNEAAAKMFSVTKIVEQGSRVAPAPGTYTFNFELKAQKNPAQAALMSARQVVPNNSVTMQVGNAAAQTVAIGESIKFSVDVVVTADGSVWSNAKDVSVWVNEEDKANLEFVVTETGVAPEYWSYDQTSKTVTYAAIEQSEEKININIKNTYNENLVNMSIPVSKTVVQDGNIEPGINTFYFKATPNVQDEQVKVFIAPADGVVDLGNGRFSLTVNDADTVEAYVVVQYPQSKPVTSVTFVEETDKTREELEAEDWIYDESAFGEGEWTLSVTEDGIFECTDTNGEVVEKIDFVNTYTANTPPPQTGDNSNIALWIALMSASALCFVVLSKRRSA